VGGIGAGRPLRAWTASLIKLVALRSACRRRGRRSMRRCWPGTASTHTWSPRSWWHTPTPRQQRAPSAWRGTG